MSEWMGLEITLGLGSIVLGMLAGRLSTWVACWLPAFLEQQWQRDARELLGLDLDNPCELQTTGSPVRGTWAAQIGCAVLSLVVTVHYGPTMQAFFALVFTWCLLALSLIDSEHHMLPDALVIPILWIGLALNSFGVFTTLHEALWGCAMGYLSLWSVFHLVKFITGIESLGAGDFKMLALIGAWTGWQALPWTAGCTLVLAALACGYLKLQKALSSTSRIPLGPFLAMAGWAGMLLPHQW
ncbi:MULTISPECIES: prepilin peptidase [Pseudomonas]|jgi:leader peptidase (prepilin peptidase)/N-methyltransferase|uniref:Prepilin type IV endopeptidase peptidase domain-containing protein n=2 Tax=Pseudomonas putida group TaxID=136845 RepID=A0AAP7FII9_9PSED|nr:MULTISPECIES: A24 family peptidase [Pseudomonas]CAI3793638.1 Type 4 prepilin-like proteins leader peptide-processing enzyme [Pseudomonas sp. MM223]CAI3793912.1 Type 4 prepilin-like proteins leader peptide-processing enzyme [Pseudomonas sp. MM221]HEP8964599.1 prepilin peptidase [Pseudomonas aeruginosa]AYN98863.1 prepilin peptidase [Pseudomonas sp. LTGT-11-2Z]ELF6208373.1 prepilin peptidase [Pseudomonas putida]